LEKKSPNTSRNFRANALLCPVCCVEYVEVEFDFEVEGSVLHNVKALRCPACEEEIFTQEQVQEIKKRVAETAT